MEGFTDQLSTDGPCDGPTIVPDSIRVAVASELVSENKPAELATPTAAAGAAPTARFGNESLPLFGAKEALHPYPLEHADGPKATALSPDPGLVLPANAARHPASPDNGKAAETPQAAAEGLDTLPPPTLPVPDALSQLPPQPQPRSEQAGPSAQPPPTAAAASEQSYSPAWQALVLARQVGAVTTRPSLCACRKLAVAATLRAGEGDGDAGGARRRPGRVCANRGKEGDCFYRAFDDAPIVPSTTVSHSTLSLVLHVRGSGQSRGAGTPEPAGPAGGEVPRIEPPAADDEGGGEQQDGAVGRTGGTGAVAGGGTGAIPGADANQDAAAGGIAGAVGESKDAVQERPSASSGKDSATSSCGAEGGGAVSSVVVEVRRWLMDCVASVHCADGPLRKAMSRLVPPELGQTHLSPDGSGQLIALHLTAVALFVASLSTLPGVLHVDGAEGTAAMFSGQQVPSTAVAPGRRPRAPQPAGGRPPQDRHSTAVHPMAAPVPVRASDMISPGVWDLANMGGAGAGNGIGSSSNSIRVRGGAPTAGPLISSFGGSVSHVVVSQTGGSSGGYPQQQHFQQQHQLQQHQQHQQQEQHHQQDNQQQQQHPSGVDVLDSEDRCDSTAAIMAAGANLLSAEPGGTVGGRGWAHSACRSIAYGNAPAGTFTTAVGKTADVFQLGQVQQATTAHSIGSSRSSSSPYAHLDAEAAAASKRSKMADGSGAMPVAPVAGAWPANHGHQLKGDASLSVSMGNTFGEGAPAYSVPNNLGDPGGIGGVGLGDLSADAFGGVGDLGGAGGVGASTVDVGSAWVDAVFDSESASSSSPFLLSDK